MYERLRRTRFADYANDDWAMGSTSRTCGNSLLLIRSYNWRGTSDERPHTTE
jgi:hypothetical protein